MMRVRALTITLAALTVAGCTSVTASKTASTTPASGQTVLSNSGNKAHPPTADVVIESCATDDVGIWHAKGTVTNHSTKPSDYSISIALNDPSGKRLGTADDYINTVMPNQAATMDATSLDTIPAGVKVACVLLTVDRTASAG